MPVSREDLAMIDFFKSTLYISLRSPFARRVRLAFLEHGLLFEEKAIDVFNPPADFVKINPLLRVPALVLKTGPVIIDSNQILSVFYRGRDWSPMMPTEINDRAFVAKWSGLGVGLAEKVVEYYLETLKPQHLQDKGFFEEASMIIENVLMELEKTIAGRESLVKGLVTQADLDMGSALDYLSLRHPMPWKTKYPNSAAYLEALNRRHAFQVTKPPPQA